MKHLSVLFALLTAFTLSAADLVSRIRVVDMNGQANREALEQLVYSTIGTRVGNDLDLPLLSKDIAALVKVNGIDDAQTKVDTLEDGTYQVTFLISLKCNISEIRIEGNTCYSDKQLLRNIKSRTGVPLDEVRVAADRREMMDKYDKAGYHGTEILSRTEKDSDGQPSILIFVVREQPRAKLKGVEFTGNSACTTGELESAIVTRRPWWRYVLRFGNYFNSMAFPLDKDRITQLYGTRGYLDCQVPAIDLKYEDETQKWVTPVYSIFEGPQYKLGERSFEGNTKFTAEELLAICRMKTGDIYNVSQASADLNAMKAKYEAAGHLDLQFYPELKKNANTGIADVVYHINEGEASRIGRITISGNSDTRDRVIRRELAIHEDDLADQRRLDQTQQRLMNLGYFSQVDVLPRTTPNPAIRDVDIQVTEKPTGSISIGAGFSTEDSVMGFLELQETNFSLSRLLSLEKPKGDGQRMRAYIGIGSDTQNVSIALTEPSLFDSQFELTNELFMNTRYEDEYDERHIGYSAMLSFPIAFELPFLPEHTEYWRLGTGLRIENVRISGITSEEKFDIEDGSYPEDWPFPPGMNYSLNDERGSEFANRLILSLSRDTRNHFIFPNRGSRLNLDAEYITKALGSYADYMKYHLGYEVYLPFYEDMFFRFAFNAFVADHVNGDDIKVFDRYFAGGFGTIRGFKRHDVSPVNRNENSIGGKSMLVGTAELIQPVKDLLFVKVFTDWGNVWWDSWDYDVSDLNGSIGLGVQFRALPVRLDYGYPIRTSGEHLDGRGGRFHFSIDYSF